MSENNSDRTFLEPEMARGLTKASANRSQRLLVAGLVAVAFVPAVASGMHREAASSSTSTALQMFVPAGGTPGGSGGAGPDAPSDGNDGGTS